MTVRQCVRTKTCKRKSGIGYRGMLNRAWLCAPKFPIPVTQLLGHSLCWTRLGTPPAFPLHSYPPPPFFVKEGQLRWSIYNEILSRENDLLSRVNDLLIREKREIILWKTIGYYLVKMIYNHEYPGEGFTAFIWSSTLTQEPLIQGSWKSQFWKKIFFSL